MRETRRTLLRTAGVALGGVGLAGCNGASDAEPTDTAEPTATATDAPDPTATPTSEQSASEATALAAEWNVMRARLHDARALSHVDPGEAAALVGDVFERFENATGEWGAHEGLEATSEATYESFEDHLGEARTAFEEGSVEDGREAAAEAERNLLAAQRGRTSQAVAETLSLLVFAARVRDVDALAAAGETDAAATVGEAAFADFEEAPVHDTLESAGTEFYEGFEGGLGDAVQAAGDGDAAAVHDAALSASSAVVDAAYERSSDAVAGVGHLALLSSVGFDAEVAAGLGGPGVDVAHAAGLNAYRVRVRDAAWLYEAGHPDAATATAQSIFEHFEGARAHEALEEADESAYETFEHDGLESLIAAIEDDDPGAVADAAETVHDGITAGIDALAGDTASLLQSGFVRARLGDVRERYDRGDKEVAASVAEDLFARFESNEADFHERLEETDESLYHAFEEEHLTALPDALRAGDDEAVETHLNGAADALAEFETTAGSTPLASAAAAAYLTGRAGDAGVRSVLGDADRAETVASDAFAYFEAGAGGFHEAVEEASEERYHAFEEALGAVRDAATGEADAPEAAASFGAEATNAVYAVVEDAGGESTAVAPLVSDVFATFENARVHEALEESDQESYESFEGALSDYVSALEGDGDVDAAAARFADATQRAAFAVAGAVEEAPEASSGDGGEEDDHGDLSGGPNVVEGVPDDADHVVDMTAVAFEPAELTVSVGDTVAWTHAGGEPHTVTASDGEVPEGASYWASGGFESEAAAREGWDAGEGAVASGQSYVHTFETAGTHAYLCIPHEMAGMEGTIVVEE